MRLAIFKVMLLGLMRDRAALAMSFILPGLVFVVFAVVFAGASGGELAIRVAVADERSDAQSKAFMARLFANKLVNRYSEDNSIRNDVMEAVRSGRADVGLVIRPSQAPFGVPIAGQPPPFEVVTDPSRAIARTMLQGNLQRELLNSGPDSGLPNLQGLMTSTPAVSGSGFSAVTYYAGAVAIMFLLFSGLLGAVTYLEEKESGLLDRLMTGIGGVGVVLDGKFLFLVVQGFLQVTVVYLVAWQVFGLALPNHLGLWSITTLTAAMASAGLALAFVTMCQTKRQAEMLGQMVIIVVSAIGGSMVPRFLMPPEMQGLGWLTPNTWALDTYAAIFWRGDAVDNLYLPWAVLAGAGLVGLLIAREVARMRT